MDPVKDAERVDLDLKVETARAGQTLAVVQHRLGKEEVSLPDLLQLDRFKGDATFTETNYYKRSKSERNS